MTKDVFCILYNGMPIEGFSSNSGYPIFTANDKYVPNFSFPTYSAAKDALVHMITSLLFIDHDHTDLSKVSVGVIHVEPKQIGYYSAYDETLTCIMKNMYNTPEAIERHVSKIIHLCVRKGFRTILPDRHHEVINSEEYAELFNKHVPFFVQDNIERFMDVGISTCTQDEIAAIILTSDDELLKAIRIDSLNNVSN